MFHPNFISRYELRNYNLKIFNRFGSKVFESPSVGLGWNPKKADVGAYYYLCTYQFKKGDAKIKKGDVTLIK